ncbi:Heterokaryon incompatibility protein (HET) domain containing protein [Hyaloscypha variabilis]
MRLLNIQTMKMEEYYDKAVPRYAILSHRWGDEEKAAIKRKSGYSKIVSCAELAQKHQFGRGEIFPLSHVWIDTCCIDKTNNAELSEAINSMFKWYRDAWGCIVYLSDVSAGLRKKEMEESVRASNWFKRGWTLQELLAPGYVEFFDQEWIHLFERSDGTDLIQSITGIDKNILNGWRQLSGACTAKKMSWAAGRVTTRQEDVAYCLLGIFDVNMPLLYGEGSRAFERLQEEIIKRSGDLSIFAWGFNTPTRRYSNRIFAYSPDDFSGCSKLTSESCSSSVISTTNITHNALLDYYCPNTGHPCLYMQT